MDSPETINVELIKGIPANRQFVVVFAVNEDDDRCVFKAANFEDEYHPLMYGGIDDFGYEQSGPWNEATSGYSDEIGSCAVEAFVRAYQESVKLEGPYAN